MEEQQISKEAIEQYKAKCVEDCGKAINDVLKQFGCSIVAVPEITSQGTIGARVSLIPNA